MAEASGAVQKVTVVTTADVWRALRESLQSKLSHETYETWFSLIEFHGIDPVEKRISLLAPNEIVRSWVTTNFSSLLRQTLVELSLQGYSIGWITDPRSLRRRPHEPVTATPYGSTLKTQVHLKTTLGRGNEHMKPSLEKRGRQTQSRSIHRQFQVQLRRLRGGFL